MAQRKTTPKAKPRPYAEQQAELVSRAGLDDRPETIHEAPLVNQSGKIRHDPARLADVLLRLASATAEASARSRPAPSVSPSGGSFVR
jgi:hypothetical protein